MKTRELWKTLKANHTHVVQVWQREYVFVTATDFAKHADLFTKQVAWFSQVPNHRSSGWFRHIHAVEYGDEICVHIDHFNPNTNFLLNIPHGIVDVLPYLTWCLIKRKRPFTK